LPQSLLFLPLPALPLAPLLFCKRYAASLPTQTPPNKSLLDGDSLAGSRTPNQTPRLRREFLLSIPGASPS
jgi:hypothetical protein